MKNPHKNFWIFLNYKAHLWLGVTTALVVVVVSVTGILLNHKRELGFMIEPANKPSKELNQALPLSQLLDIAITKFNHPGYQSEKGINRMDFRPSRGYIKVRFRDPDNTEVIIDTSTGGVMSMASRQDVFMEQLHSGELFGAQWILLSDVTAVALIILTFSGIYIWLFPSLRNRKNKATAS